MSVSCLLLALLHKIWKRRVLKGSDFMALITFIASSMALFKKLTCFSATLAILQNKLILAAVAWLLEAPMIYPPLFLKHEHNIFFLRAGNIPVFLQIVLIFVDPLQVSQNPQGSAYHHSWVLYTMEKRSQREPFSLKTSERREALCSLLCRTKKREKKELMQWGHRQEPDAWNCQRPEGRRWRPKPSFSLPRTQSRKSHQAPLQRTRIYHRLVQHGTA